VSRRVVGAASLLASLLSGPAAPALATPPRATFQVAESDFKPLPGTKPPIMYADIKGGAGVEGGAKDGSRVAVHFDVKFRRITVATSRQGAGVTGGTPYGFTVGVPAGTPGGPFIACLNEGIKGMGPGQFRRLIVPPEYAYGSNQVQEIPPNATLTVDVELLSIAARA
jgi:FKBP-type peptidyl-prolyl cis-trans isomerase